ncbi:hypothetical protein BGZ95_004424, partial [Linnemannia exigua]
TKDRDNVKHPHLLKSSIPNACSEEYSSSSTAKNSSKDEPGDSSQKHRVLVKHPPSVPAKVASMDEL